MLAIAALVAGCATHSINWQGRVGNYTYDQAVVEMGPPQSSARLTDGTVVADWLTQRSQVFITENGPYYPTRPVFAPSIQAVTAVSTPAYYLRLTFDPTGRLKAWKNVAR